MRAAHSLGRLPARELKVRDRLPLPASLVARLRASKLDTQLADGVESWRSPAHAARSLQLTSPRRRRVLARSLERLLEDVERPPVMSAVVRPCHGQVLEARPLIVAVAARLRSNRPVDARGMAHIRALLTDGGSPCYSRSHPHALDGALESAVQWLDAPD
jgi:hypothetical protein